MRPPRPAWVSPSRARGPPSAAPRPVAGGRVGSGVGDVGIGGLRSSRRECELCEFTFLHISSRSNPWTPDPGECTLSAEVFEGASNVPGGRDNEGWNRARVRGGPHRPGGGSGRAHRGVPAAGGVDAPQGPVGPSPAGGREGGGRMRGRGG